MNLLKDEIKHLEEVTALSIDKAGATLTKVVLAASRELDEKIERLTIELHNQRRLTKDDIKELVVFSRKEVEDLIDEKVEVIKQKISSQKRTIQNATIAASSAIAIAVVAFMYQKTLQGDIDVLFVFKVLFLSIGLGYATLAAVKALQRFLSFPRVKRNMVTAAIGYWALVRPKGIYGHVVIFAACILIWIYLSYPEAFSQLLQGIRVW